MTVAATEAATTASIPAHWIRLTRWPRATSPNKAPTAGAVRFRRRN